MVSRIRCFQDHGEEEPHEECGGALLITSSHGGPEVSGAEETSGPVCTLAGQAPNGLLPQVALALCNAMNLRTHLIDPLMSQSSHEHIPKAPV